MAYTTYYNYSPNAPGSSASNPIDLTPLTYDASSSSLSTKQSKMLPHHQQLQHQYWGQPAPSLDEFTFGNDSFAWPTAWFDVPAVSPPMHHNHIHQRRNFEMHMQSANHARFASELDLDAVPELDHSKTPESLSPTQLHETCITPSQDATVNAVVCDVPLLAPRPLPYTPPTFLQFDLPEDDEDLSFPPYTHSRKHRKRSVQQLESSAPASTFAADDMSNDVLPPSAKRQKISTGAYAYTHTQPAIALSNNDNVWPQSHHQAAYPHIGSGSRWTAPTSAAHQQRHRTAMHAVGSIYDGLDMTT